MPFNFIDGQKDKLSASQMLDLARMETRMAEAETRRKEAESRMEEVGISSQFLYVILPYN
jgi:hypothetical protein